MNRPPPEGFWCKIPLVIAILTVAAAVSGSRIEVVMFDVFRSGSPSVSNWYLIASGTSATVPGWKV